MLKYKVRLDSTKLQDVILKWREKYVSHDLSFISGVTDTSYKLELHDKVQASNSLSNSDSILTVSAQTITRNGFIIVKGKEYNVLKNIFVDYSNNAQGDNIAYTYIEVNGVFYYLRTISDDGQSGFTITNFLTYDINSNTVEERNIVIPYSSGDIINLDTIYWIEDNSVCIDGNRYFYDKNENGGTLRYTDNGVGLSPSSITKCNGIEFHPYEHSSDFLDVTKFILSKSPMQEETFDTINYCRFNSYILYKNVYCPIIKTINDDGYVFQCEIPSYLISGDNSDKGMTYKDVIYFMNGSESPYFNPQVHIDSAFSITLTEANINANHLNITSLDDLNMYNTYIFLEGSYFKVETDIFNGNSGNYIMVQLSQNYTTLSEESYFTLSTSKFNEYSIRVYNDNGDKYIILDGIKYNLVPNLQDKALINGNKCNIDYINGKQANVDCLVDIDGEYVPMKIINTDQGEYNSGQIQRYGLIVDNEDASYGVYDIKPYDGVIIDNKTYIAYYPSNDNDGTVIFQNDEMADGADCFIAYDGDYSYKFKINEIRGNSLLICEPLLNSMDFSAATIKNLSSIICQDVVDNQIQFTLYITNKIFGSEIISDKTVFHHTLRPSSSNDYYNLFDDLSIYVPQGYIDVRLPLYMDAASNHMQEDIINKDFFNEERKKAINPIVDMEKDIYVPKYLNTVYSGSKTEFSDIVQMNFNLHFRTRNLDTWKINESNNDYSVSGDSSSNSLDNWFTTDFYPYKNLLDKKGDELLETSDIMGLLYFTNDDIFYQREKVAKSFLRLSFYDSIDPQTQSLLATSCIFMDEHKLYKNYIDNSRKNINDYAKIEMPQYKRNDMGYIITPKEDITELSKLNKISVLTEYLGSKKENKPYDKNNCDIIIDENLRISSRLAVKSKYMTDTSSEGYYLYMFREYSEKLHPKPIYMKVEFNHAGVGRTIPFIIPMKWSKDENINKNVPVRTLKLSSQEDRMLLFNGVPLSYVYAQSYIPLYAVYDFINKEYCYVFDNRYISVNGEGIANINLFEMKIQDESNNVDNDNTSTIINVNGEQFNPNSFMTLQF